MTKKLLVIILLVIVLVSVNWFRQLLAQDLSSLDAQKRTELQERYQSRLDQQQAEVSYRTADIFGRDSIVADRIGPAETPGDDQVEATTEVQASGREEMPDFAALRPFGYELFRPDANAGEPVDIPSAAEYVLGPGDNLLIYLWGRVEKEYNLTLDREGKVFIPKIGSVVGWGLTLQQFTVTVKDLFSRVYSDFEATVSLGKIRSIRIYVTGEVKNPGAYTVPSVTSLFNAIYIAGGPNQRGSMRTIKLMRSGRPEATVDIYALLLEGDNSVDVRMQTGDVVFIPVTGPRVAIRGEVRRSAIYELKGEESVADLIALAGGTTAHAHRDRIMMERISDDAEWEVLDIDLSQSTSDLGDGLPLRDGDRLTVFSIFDLRTNIVALFGQVKHPGYYERDSTTRVSHIIEQGQLQPYDVYYDRADLFRRHPDGHLEVMPVNLSAVVTSDTDADRLLKDRDSIYVYSIDEVERDKWVYIEGEVRRPGRYRLFKNITVEDLVFLAGSYTRSANRFEAELARIDSVGEVSLLTVSLDDSGSMATELEEDDRLYIRQIPEWLHDRTVLIDGEVRYPGRYTLASRNETLYQLLRRAGGCTRNAFPKGIILERQAIGRSLEQLRIPQTLKRSQPLYRDSSGNIVHQQVFPVNTRSMNRIILDMDRILSTAGQDGDVVLEPDDHVFVPPIPSGISVMGAVGANGTIKFVEDKSVRYYIKRAGNFTRQADKGGTRLIRAGGEVFSGGGVLGREVALGDIVIVPAKIEKERKWLKNITAAVTAATGVLTSVYIVSKL